MSWVEAVIGGGVLVLLIVAFVVTLLKGKYVLGLLGLLGIGYLIWPITVIRLAKPDSWWARKYYDEDELGAAKKRFSRRSRRMSSPAKDP